MNSYITKHFTRRPRPPFSLGQAPHEFREMQWLALYSGARVSNKSLRVTILENMLKRHIFYFLLMCFASSCSTGNDPNFNGQFISVKLKYTGSSETLKILDDDFNPGNGATYIDSVKVTSINLLDVPSSEPLHLQIFLYDNKIGEYDWEAYQYLMYINKNHQIRGLITISGKTNITMYGAVGERIEGSINGIVRTTTSEDRISVKGNFSVLRLNDFY